MGDGCKLSFSSSERAKGACFSSSVSFRIPVLSSQGLSLLFERLIPRSESRRFQFGPRYHNKAEPFSPPLSGFSVRFISTISLL